MIYLQFSDDGRHIRKWSREPFEGGDGYGLIPTGWRALPIEPTDDMLISATEEWMCERAMEDRAAVIWTAMLAAAPECGDQQRSQDAADPLASDRAQAIGAGGSVSGGDVVAIPGNSRGGEQIGEQP